MERRGEVRTGKRGQDTKWQIKWLGLSVCIWIKDWSGGKKNQRVNLRFLHHTHWHTTVCRNALNGRSARRRDLYLTTHNTQNRQPCPGGIFCILLFSFCTIFLLISLSWFSCILPFCLYLQHATQTSMLPARFFFLFSLCTLSVLLHPDFPGFCFLSLLYNTQHKHSCLRWIRTRNPSRRAAANHHLRPLVHRKRLQSLPRILLHKTIIQQQELTV